MTSVKPPVNVRLLRLNCGKADSLSVLYAAAIDHLSDVTSPSSRRAQTPAVLRAAAPTHAGRLRAPEPRHVAARKQPRHNGYSRTGKYQGIVEGKGYARPESERRRAILTLI